MQFTKAAAYVLSFVQKKPRSQQELLAQPAIRRQFTALTRFAKLNNVRLERSFVDTTTYRSARFINSPVFAEALALAAGRGIPLLVADIGQLVAATGQEAVSVMNSLDAHGAVVFDVRSERYWSEFDGAARMLIGGAATSTIRKRAKRNVSAAEIDRTLNQKRGAAANRINADRRSAQLKPIVEAFEASLPDGQALSPSMLARHLNELGLRSARGGEWSHNTAKRLLERIHSE